jgi:S1-C subfamily serine protease
MKRAPLYSPSSPPERPSATTAAPSAAAAAPAGAATAPPPATAQRRRAWLVSATAALLGAALAAALLLRFGPPGARALTQDDIDRAVLHTLNTKSLPAPAAKAFEAVRGSVVKVIGLSDPKAAAAADTKDSKESKDPKKGKDGKDSKPGKDAQRAQPKVERDGTDAGREEREERGIGTGVVIMDNGTILTNLHVVFGARRIKVIFADGLEADADVIALRPEHDLAVLRARKIPDDLHAATMRSTHDLRPGDRVTAVGFPFGIGPSVSHGVVSGLKREFRSPEGQRILTNLIQFDAAANPGNSGGPLVTDDGEVVGIVTAIYNPTEERFFVGIGFAVPIENAAQAAGMPPF